MTISTCDACCNPQAWWNNNDAFKSATLQILCGILAATGGTGGVRYDWEILCDPLTDAPVFVRFAYSTDGTIIGVSAFNTDGTPWVGDLDDLESCEQVTVGDVSVISVIPGVGATNLGKAEDAPAASGDTGVAALFKRTDTAAVQTDANNDYILGSTNSFGAIHTDIDFTFQAVQASGLLKAEDTGHVTADAGVFALAVRNSSDATVTTTDADYSQISTNLRGALFADVRAAMQSNPSGDHLLKRQDGPAGAQDAGVNTFGQRTDTLISQAANLDYVFETCDLFGRRLIANAPPQVTFAATNASAIVDTTSTQIVASGGGTIRNNITDLSITNESAVPTRVDILDGATVIWRAYVGGGVIGVADGSNTSYEHTFATPLRGTAATAVNAKPATTGGSIFVSMAGYLTSV